jgi:hypothetical protein
VLTLDRLFDPINIASNSTLFIVHWSLYVVMIDFIRSRFVLGTGLIMISTLAGCTTYWARPGGTAEEFHAASASCQARATSQYPPFFQPVMVSNGYVTPVQTSCTRYGYTTNCISTGGQYVPPAYVNVDQNQNARADAAQACLMAQGWRPFDKKDEADAYARSGR